MKLWAKFGGSHDYKVWVDMMENFDFTTPDILLISTMGILYDPDCDKKFDVLGRFFDKESLKPEKKENVIPKLSKDAVIKAEWELVAYVSFIVMFNCRQHNVSEEILDEYKERLAVVLTNFGLLRDRDNQVRFNKLLCERYDDYYEAFHNQDDYRLEHMADLVYKNVFGIDIGRNLYTAMIMRVSILSAFTSFSQAIETIINQHSLGMDN